MSQNVTSTQRLAIIALLEGKDTTKAAEAAGVTRQTVSRWKQNPEFRKELFRMEGEATADATRRLAGLLNKSVDELDALLSDKNLSSLDRIRVIRTIMDNYPRLAEITRIDIRLSELEEILKNGASGKNK